MRRTNPGVICMTRTGGVERAMLAIHPPVKPNARLPWRAWLATGAVVPPPADTPARSRRPFALLVAALIVGGLIGWGLR